MWNFKKIMSQNFLFSSDFCTWLSPKFPSKMQLYSCATLRKIPKSPETGPKNVYTRKLGEIAVFYAVWGMYDMLVTKG